jgi:hypothetical protein
VQQKRFIEFTFYEIGVNDWLARQKVAQKVEPLLEP